MGPPRHTNQKAKRCSAPFGSAYALWAWFLTGKWPSSGAMSQLSMANPILEKEVARRRTFAIISHPDAGKTTLTEKLLLYGGAIHLAGAVRAKANPRNT